MKRKTEIKDKLNKETTFDGLVSAISGVHSTLNAQAGRAVNISLTLRNWFIGCYIAEYQLNGADRAIYGESLLHELSKKLTHISNCNHRQLYRYKSFYRTYPQILGTVSPKLQLLIPDRLKTESQKVRTASAQFKISPEKLLKNLSFSKFEQLIDIDDETKRVFYEIECMRGNWSVRELKRQISSLYYERTGLSHDKETLTEIAHDAAEQADSASIIRDPYIFEFLGLKPSEVMEEADLESALIGKLQEFMLELGEGFCFEARQKRILIGDTYGFIDLVFYHRTLKCHILIDLKLEEFSHENIGQLNTYVSWYRKNMMAEDDNPPIGILLCTKKNHALVEYALAGIDNQLFVSKYQLALPDKKQMQAFMEREIAEIELKDDTTDKGMLVREMQATYRANNTWER